MSEILAGIGVIGWIAALYCFIRLREARKEVAAWKKVAEDSRRETTGWRNEALRAMEANRRDASPEQRRPE